MKLEQNISAVGQLIHIKQELFGDICDVPQVLVNESIDLKERGIHDILTQLGWTSPEDTIKLKLKLSKLLGEQNEDH